MTMKTKLYCTILLLGISTLSFAQQRSRGADEMMAVLNQTLQAVQDDNAQLKMRIAELERKVETLSRKNAESENRVKQLQRQFSAESSAREQQMKDVSKQLKIIASMPAAVSVPPPASAGKKKNSPPPEASYEEYVVQSGDTLGAIAAAYETSVSTIKKANGLKSDRLRLGQKLKIPAK